MVTKEDKEYSIEDWAEELRQFFPAENVRRPGGITHAEYAELEGIGERQAAKRLLELLKKGELTREMAKCADGRKRFVYYQQPK
jgi:hypothetical protein